MAGEADVEACVLERVYQALDSLAVKAPALVRVAVDGVAQEEHALFGYQGEDAVAAVRGHGGEEPDAHAAEVYVQAALVLYGRGLDNDRLTLRVLNAEIVVAAYHVLAVALVQAHQPVLVDAPVGVLAGYGDAVYCMQAEGVVAVPVRQRGEIRVPEAELIEPGVELFDVPLGVARVNCKAVALAVYICEQRALALGLMRQVVYPVCKLCQRHVQSSTATARQGAPSAFRYLSGRAVNLVLRPRIGARPQRFSIISAPSPSISLWLV